MLLKTAIYLGTTYECKFSVYVIRVCVNNQRRKYITYVFVIIIEFTVYESIQHTDGIWIQIHTKCNKIVMVSRVITQCKFAISMHAAIIFIDSFKNKVE